MDLRILTIRLVSWNVNGVRAAVRNGLLDFISKEKAEIYAFQEIKADEFQLPLDLLNEGYAVYINPAEKKGYSGTMILSKIKPISTFKGFNSKHEEREGRILGLEFEKFWFLNIYFPNSQRELTRLEFKLDFNRKLHSLVNELRKSKSVIFCGDMNVAHKEIDIARPDDNHKNAGFTDEERAWMSELLEDGYVDTFRMFDSEPGKYSWWTYRFNARARNVGWRIDYFIVSHDLKENVKDARILGEVTGSDHAPVTLTVEL